MNNNNSTNHRDDDATTGGSLRERLANVSSSLSARSLPQSTSTNSPGYVAFLRTLGTTFIKLLNPDLFPSQHVPLRNVGTPYGGEADPVQAAAFVAPAAQVAGPDTLKREYCDIRI